jgi:hypothetical protein
VNDTGDHRVLPAAEIGRSFAAMAASAALVVEAMRPLLAQLQALGRLHDKLVRVAFVRRVGPVPVRVALRWIARSSRRPRWHPVVLWRWVVLQRELLDLEQAGKGPA